MANILEAMMLIAFGMAWPSSIVKSYRSRTSKGKSIFFLFIVVVGYMCGIAAKIAGNNVNYVTYLYMINLFLVFIDVGLYFRNRKLDALNES